MDSERNRTKAKTLRLHLLTIALFAVIILFGHTSLYAQQTSGDDFKISYTGDRLSGKTRNWLSDPITVIVTDSDGIPVEGIRVDFRSKDEEINIEKIKTVTDEKGIAQTQIQFGSRMGDYEIETRVHLPDSLVYNGVILTAFDPQKLLFYLLGGLAVFLFGIVNISDSLRIAAGDNLKKLLGKLTANSWLGVGVGVGVTALLQSSGATSVMAIGFVNAGLLTIKQAISVIIGANIGTTVTAQIMAFDMGGIDMPAIAIGTAFVLFSKSYRVKAYGRIILGFGFLFLGLNLMTDVVIPLRSSVVVSDIFLKYSSNHLLALLAGVVMTIIIQSSSATVGIAIVLAVGGLVDIYSAMALVLGDNIGTTVIGAFACIGASPNAKRTALSNVLIKVVGAAYMMVILFFFASPVAHFLEYLSGSIGRQVANFHTLFNIINGIVFIPLIPLLEKTVNFIIPDAKEVEKRVTKYLSSELLSEPSIAIDQVKMELSNMINNATKVFSSSIKSLESINRLLIEETYQGETENDNYQLEITDFIARLARREMAPEDSNRIPVLLHLTNDLERVADYSRNIAEIAERKLDKEIEFNNEQKAVIEDMSDTLFEMLRVLPKALKYSDQDTARYVTQLENKMNQLEVTYKKQQVKEISTGKPIEPAIMTIDIITNIEKAGDHLHNFAQAIMGALSEDKKALYSDLITNSTAN